MEKVDCLPTGRMYASALRACARGGSPEQALALLDLIEEEDRHAVRDAVARSYASTGHAKTATQLLVQMVNEGDAVSSETFDAALKACAGQQSWRQALKLLRSMDTAGVPASNAGLDAALGPCAVHGRWQDALMLLKRFGEHPRPSMPRAFETTRNGLGPKLRRPDVDRSTPKERTGHRLRKAQDPQKHSEGED